MNPQTTFDFSQALLALKNGMKVSRLGWNGKGMFLQVQTPDENSKMSAQYIYLTAPSGNPDNALSTIPWVASQSDLFGLDWVTV